MFPDKITLKGVANFELDLAIIYGKWNRLDQMERCLQHAIIAIDKLKKANA